MNRPNCVILDGQCVHNFRMKCKTLFEKQNGKDTFVELCVSNVISAFMSLDNSRDAMFHFTQEVLEVFAKNGANEEKQEELRGYVYELARGLRQALLDLGLYLPPTDSLPYLFQRLLPTEDVVLLYNPEVGDFNDEHL